MSDEDLDGLVRRVDPDRWLSSRLIADPAARADVIALYAYDHELARATRVASNPLLGEIRLTWWREALDEIFEGRDVRHHPAAQALALAVRRHRLPRAPMEAMIDARYRELDPAPMTGQDARDLARDTGGRAAGLAAMVLAPSTECEFAASAGSAWSLAHAIGAGRAGDARLDLAQARRDARRLAVAAFPAVAHAALAPLRARGTKPSEFQSRVRLLWASMTGRI